MHNAQTAISTASATNCGSTTRSCTEQPPLSLVVAVGGRGGAILSSAGNNFNVYASHPFDDKSRDYRRLLVQLDETERRFDDFWSSHLLRLRQCLELRRFEQAFRELQVWQMQQYGCVSVAIRSTRFHSEQTTFDEQLQAIVEMTEIGETVTHANSLMRQTKLFQTACDVQIERANEVIATGTCVHSTTRNWRIAFVCTLCGGIIPIGQQLISVTGACPADVVQPKCDELSRVCDLIADRLARRIDLLGKNRDLMMRVEKVSERETFDHRESSSQSALLLAC